MSWSWFFRMDYNNWKTLKPIQTPAGMYGDTHDPFSDHSDKGFECFIISHYVIMTSYKWYGFVSTLSLSHLVDVSLIGTVWSLIYPFSPPRGGRDVVSHCQSNILDKEQTNQVWTEKRHTRWLRLKVLTQQYDDVNMSHIIWRYDDEKNPWSPHAKWK